MKYTSQVVINLPINEVIVLFDNEKNLFKWQPELISFEHLSGEKGEVGAKSKLIYKMGKREVEMIETITVKDLPHEFSGIYEAKGVWNEVKNYFQQTDGNATQWTSVCHFEFKGFMKLIALIMPGSFKKQSQKYLDQFKAFAEEKSRQY
jgi:hypothetical protein